MVGSFPDGGRPFPGVGGKAPCIGLLGAGRVGCALALALEARGYPVEAVASRAGERAGTLARLLPSCQATSPEDRKIPRLVDALPFLQPARRAGALVGAFHPLQTLPEPVRSPSEALEALKGIAWAVEGDVYHASCVAACALLVSLVRASVEMWRAMGFSEEEALRDHMPHLLPIYRSLALFLLRHLPEAPERAEMEALLEGGEAWPG